MSFNYRETQIIKGMLARGDKQHDVAAYFGVNGGRIAEVATGKCAYPSAPPLQQDKLPPAGPYVGAKTVFEVRSALTAAVEQIRASAGTESDRIAIAIDALAAAAKKLS